MIGSAGAYCTFIQSFYGVDEVDRHIMALFRVDFDVIESTRLSALN